MKATHDAMPREQDAHRDGHCVLQITKHYASGVCRRRFSPSGAAASRHMANTRGLHVPVLCARRAMGRATRDQTVSLMPGGKMPHSSQEGGGWAAALFRPWRAEWHFLGPSA